MGFGNSSKDNRLKAKLWVVWGRGNGGKDRGHSCVLFEEIFRKRREKNRMCSGWSVRSSEGSVPALRQRYRKKRQRGH